MKRLSMWLATVVTAASFVLTWGLAAQAEKIRVRRYIYKKTPQAELALYVHFPADWKADDKRPAIVFFFGGGWTAGTVRQFEPQANHFAQRGLVTVRADYRVKSRHGVLPDKCVEDAKSAIRWVRAHAGELGVDPNRIVAAGGSAGGHLAACTSLVEGLDAEGEDLNVSSKPNALLLYNPALDLTGERIVKRVGNNQELARRISPTLHLKKATPPALLLYGTDDPLLEQGRAFMERSKAIGHHAELYLAPGQRHGFFNRSPWLERTTQRADQFLQSIGYLRAPVEAGRAGNDN